jgi:hypothetical protein
METQRLANGPTGNIPRGIYKVIKAFRSYGVRSESLKYYEQVIVATKIRNCLIHANGLLAASSNQAELRAAIARRIFFENENRNRKRASTAIHIVADDLGDRICITNEYSHVANFYLREYFVRLCREADRVLFSAHDASRFPVIEPWGPASGE